MWHFKSDYPATKRKELKCLECKGVGYTEFKCPNKQKGKEKSFLSFSESDSDMPNFVAFTTNSGDLVDADESESNEE